MTTQPQAPRRSLAPEELAHVSFDVVHHQDTMVHPPPIGYRSGMPSPSLGYTIEELPQETRFYSAGQPILLHYLEAGDNTVDTNVRYYVPSAARSTRVQEDLNYQARKEHYLEAFAESFPAEAERLGPPLDSSTAVYTFFTRIARQVSNTIVASRVSFPDQNGRTIEGFFIQPKDYRLLYRALNECKTRYQRVVQDIFEIGRAHV